MEYQNEILSLHDTPSVSDEALCSVDSFTTISQLLYSINKMMHDVSKEGKTKARRKIDIAVIIFYRRRSCAARNARDWSWKRHRENWKILEESIHQFLRSGSNIKSHFSEQTFNDSGILFQSALFKLWFFSLFANVWYLHWETGSLYEEQLTKLRCLSFYKYKCGFDYRKLFFAHHFCFNSRWGLNCLSR